MNMPILIPELKVSDFEKSLDFYTRLCGFTVRYDRPEEKFAMLERDGAMLMIEQMVSGERWIVGERKYPLGQGINFQIEVKDVDALRNDLKNKGYEVFFEIEEKWYRSDTAEGGNRQFLVQDPDGYLLRFFQDLGSRPLQK